MSVPEEVKLFDALIIEPESVPTTSKVTEALAAVTAPLPIRSEPERVSFASLRMN